jgi:2'-5' RNA ligase
LVQTRAVVKDEGTSDLGKTRLFLAVALDDETRSLVAAHLGSHAADLPGRPVPPENWHLTLRFLGWTSDVQRDRILGSLDEADLGGPFRIRFAGLGAFPKPRRATVLWVGVDAGVEPLTRLAEACEDATQAAGFEREDRPYHAHLTVARVRPPVDVGPLVESVPPLDLGMRVNEITLFRSHLGRGGAIYEPVDSIAL